MRVLNAVQRIIMLLLLVPVVIICLNALLRALNAQKQNPIVSAVRDARDAFVLPMFRTVFAGKNELQDDIVTLVAIGALALAVIFLFRALRAMVGTRPPKKRPAPAAKKPAASETTTKTTKTEEPAPAAASSKSSSDGDSTDAPAAKKAPEDTQSTSG